MVAPIDQKWNRNDGSDANLNKTTYGQGTSFPGTWPTDRLFWRTDQNLVYKNTNTEGSPIWTIIGGGSQSGISLPTLRIPNLFLKTDTHILYQLKPLSITDNAYSTWGVHNQVVNAFKLNKNTVNPIISENFTDYESVVEAELAWIPESTQSFVYPDITADAINVTFPNSTSNRFCNLDLVTAVSDTAWVMRMKVTVTATTYGGTGDHSLILGLSSNTSNSSSAQDFIGCIMFYENVGNTKTWHALYADGVSPRDSGTKSASIRTVVVETLYIEIKRLSGTSSSVELFSDASFSTSLGSATQTPPSTIQALRYVKFAINDLNEATNSFQCTIDDIGIKDGVTTW